MNNFRKLLLSSVLLLSVFNNAYCQNEIEESYREVLETTFEKATHKKNQIPKYKKKYETVFIYRNDRLIEERKDFLLSNAKIKTKYAYTYDRDGRVKARKFFDAKDEQLQFVEKFKYDTSGNLISVIKHDAIKRTIDTTEVYRLIKNDLNPIPKPGTQIILKDNGRDSTVIYRTNPYYKIKPQTSHYKKNDKGDVVSESIRYFTSKGDSSIFSKKAVFYYLKDSLNWDYQIAEIQHIAWNNEEIHFKDSITREVIMSTEKTNLLKKNMVGNWNMQARKETTFKLYENMEFEITQRGKVTSAGKWKLSEPERKFTLIFEKGDPKGEKHECEIIEIFEEQLIMKYHGIEQVFIRI